MTATAKIFKIIEEFFIKVKILIADFKSKKAVLKISALKIIIPFKNSSRPAQKKDRHEKHYLKKFQIFFARLYKRLFQFSILYKICILYKKIEWDFEVMQKEAIVGIASPSDLKLKISYFFVRAVFDISVWLPRRHADAAPPCFFAE